MPPMPLTVLGHVGRLERSEVRNSDHILECFIIHILANWSEWGGEFRRGMHDMGAFQIQGSPTSEVPARFLASSTT